MEHEKKNNWKKAGIIGLWFAGITLGVTLTVQGIAVTTALATSKAERAQVEERLKKSEEYREKDMEYKALQMQYNADMKVMVSDLRWEVNRLNKKHGLLPKALEDVK